MKRISRYRGISRDSLKEISEKVQNVVDATIYRSEVERKSNLIRAIHMEVIYLMAEIHAEVELTST